MAEDDQRQQPRKSTSKRKNPSKKTTRSPGSAGPSEPTLASSATEPHAALDLEPDTFAPPDEPTPADVELEEDYAPVSAEPIEWTPERAGALVRGGGYLLHTADGLARDPGGEELWRATEADIAAIAPPLSRILNRYEPARRLAGLSDEAELAIGLMGYARRNLADRGRLVTARRQAEEAATEPTWPLEPEPPAQ